MASLSLQQLHCHVQLSKSSEGRQNLITSRQLQDVVRLLTVQPLPQWYGVAVLLLLLPLA